MDVNYNYCALVILGVILFAKLNGTHRSSRASSFAIFDHYFRPFSLTCFGIIFGTFLSFWRGTPVVNQVHNEKRLEIWDRNFFETYVLYVFSPENQNKFRNAWLNFAHLLGSISPTNLTQSTRAQVSNAWPVLIHQHLCWNFT